MNTFWNWRQNEGESRTLYLEGAISESTWWGDEITPTAFKKELHSGTGDVIVWINSPGGDVFAAAAIYSMLKEYPGKVTVKIDAMAASAASVVAMAGDEVLISPVGHILIHNPSTIAIGDSDEMMKAKRLLDSVKDSIINAYEIKSGLSRIKLSHMMDAETDMPAQIAVALGFADEILYQSEGTGNKLQIPGVSAFTPRTVLNSLLDKMRKDENISPAAEESAAVPADPPGIVMNTEQRTSLFNKIIKTEVTQ
jgi:ATP-dependent Clp protease protease subunit